MNTVQVYSWKSEQLPCFLVHVEESLRLSTSWWAGGCRSVYLRPM